MLSVGQRDRALGVLLGLAAGDALGAPYEFGPARGPELPIEMAGGGGLGWAPGEWTDDTSMAIVIARVAADGLDLRTAAAQDRIVADWTDWAVSAPDVGIQTREVLGVVRAGGRLTAAAALLAAEDQHRRTGRTAGNGSLMRTSPVALAYLHDADALVDAARAVSALTHADRSAAEACVLWCLAIRHAVHTGELEPGVGLDRLPAKRRDVWAARIAEAAGKRPTDFPQNGWVVHAFQAAWSAIATTSAAGPDGHVARALEAAARCGGDTDTVAAIAGSSVHAAGGAAQVPAAWTELLHGWPGLDADGLRTLAGGIVDRSS
jgi:ADP-ribosyl-[dinitrogen reductase] hydrolase